MPGGIEVFDEAGRSVFNGNTLGFGLIHIFHTGVYDGAWVSPYYPEVVAVSRGSGELFDSGLFVPEVKSAGNRVSWHYPADVPVDRRQGDWVYVFGC